MRFPCPNSFPLPELVYIFYLLATGITSVFVLLILFFDGFIDDYFWNTIIDRWDLLHFCAKSMAASCAVVSICCLIGIFVSTPALKSRAQDRAIYHVTDREVLICRKNVHSLTLSENSHTSDSLKALRCSEAEDKDYDDADAGDTTICTGNEFRKGQELLSDSLVDPRGYGPMNTRIDYSDLEYLKIQDPADLSNSTDNEYYSYYAHPNYLCNSVSDKSGVRKSYMPRSFSYSDCPYYTTLSKISQSSRLRTTFEALDIDESPYVMVNVVPAYERRHVLLRNRPINLVLLSLIFVAHSFPHALIILVCLYLRMCAGDSSHIFSDLVHNTSTLAEIIKIQSKYDCRFHNIATFGPPTSGSRSLQSCLNIYLRYIKTLEIFSGTLSLVLVVVSAGVLPHVLMSYVSQWRSVGVQTLPRSQWWFGVGQSANIRCAKVQCTLELDEQMRLQSHLWITKHSQIFSEHDDADFDD